jgi:predicted ATPase/class 3 adenylate cyclase
MSCSAYSRLALCRPACRSLRSISRQMPLCDPGWVGDLPSGTVTFLFTDIEGSTRLWQERPEEMPSALAEHDDLVRGAIESHGGYVFATGGDGFAAAFTRAEDALAAAAKAQATLAEHEFISVRMGVHTGEAHERGGDYFGPAVNRAARVMDAGHGAQTLISEGTVGVIGSDGMTDLGSHQLRDLGPPQHVFQVGAADFPTLRTVDAFPGNLPTELDSFIGRTAEIADIIDQLDSHRLVTLTGVGGVGKTRLALQVAAELMPKFEHGCWLVELSSTRDGAAVPAEIASSLAIRERPGESPLETVQYWLKNQARLVVLDNCEHLIEEVGDAIETIITSCPDVRVIATSREGLSVKGEQVVPVPSLRAHATELFMARAVEVNPAFASEADVATVDDLCTHLDGLPLAIELAAARTRTLTPAEILDRLDQRFRLLTGGRRRVERHQTIRGTIEWSYELLDPDEQIVFNRLGAFAGSFSATDAEAVASDGEAIMDLDVLDHLDSLVSKCMIQADLGGETASFRLLETLRQFAEERLLDAGEEATVRDRHAGVILALAERWERERLELQKARANPLASATLTRLFSAMDEIDAALDWLIESGDLDRATDLVSFSAPVFVTTSLDKWTRHCDQLIARRGEMLPESQVRLLAVASVIAWSNSDFQRSIAWGELAIATSASEGVPFPIGVSIGTVTALALSGQVDRSCEVAELALKAAREAPDDDEDRHMKLVFALFAMGTTSLYRSPSESAEWGREALTEALAVGHPGWVVGAQMIIARALVFSDPDMALTIAQEAAGERSRLPGVGFQLSRNSLAAGLEAQAGNTKEASAHILEGLTDVDTLRLHYMFMSLLDSAAITYAPLDAQASAALLGARSALQQHTGLELGPYEQHLRENALAAVRSHLSDDEFETALAEGHEAGFDHAVETVRELAAQVEACAEIS